MSMHCDSSMPWSTFVKKDTLLTGKEVPRYTVPRKVGAERQRKPKTTKLLTSSALLTILSVKL